MTLKSAYVGVNAVAYIGTYDTETSSWTTAYEVPLGTRISNLRVARNINRVYGLGQRTPKALIPLRYSAEWGMDSTLTAHALANILTNWAMGGNSKLSELKTVPTYDIMIEFTDGKVYFVDEAFVREFSIEMTTDNPVQFSMSGGAYQIEQSDTSTYSEPSSPTTDDNDIATFINGSLTYGTYTLGVVTRVRVNARLDTDAVYGLGDVRPQKFIPRQISVNGNFTIVVEADNMNIINDLVQASMNSAQLELTLAYPQAGSKKVRIPISYISNVRSAVQPNQMVTYNISFEGSDIEIV